MSLHKKPIKAHGEKVSERTSELHSSSVFILLSLIPVPPPPPLLNHKLKPQMTNRFQTPCFDCQKAEFRFFDGARAFTSLPWTHPQGHPWERLDYRLDPEDQLNILPFPAPQNMNIWGGPKQKSSIRSSNSEKGARSNRRSNIQWRFFFGLIWLAVLQLHLIPTGKPSSGTDFRAPGPGWEKGGNCSVKAWFPSGAQASSQSFWLKGVLAQLHPMTGPCSQARPW